MVVPVPVSGMVDGVVVDGVVVDGVVVVSGVVLGWVPEAGVSVPVPGVVVPALSLRWQAPSRATRMEAANTALLVVIVTFMIVSSSRGSKLACRVARPP